MTKGLEPGKLLEFPEGFLWGASCSSHQCEGDNHNDWTVWEKNNAPRLAAESFKMAKQSPVWREIEPAAINPENYISGKAADHYNRYEEDFDIAQKLGMSAVRISLEWSRIEPQEGQFDEAAIDHYRAVIQAMKKRGLEPFVTIWHWSLPTWIAETGGWQNPATIERFANYSVKVVAYLKKDVKYWMTLNEPDVYTDMSFRAGKWPPQKHSIRTAYRVTKNLVAGHISAYRTIKQFHSEAQIGVAKNNIHFDLRRHWLLDYVVRNTGEIFWNTYFLNKIAKYQDFIGLNHYFRYKHKERVTLDRPHVYTSDMGWELHPESIYFVLKNLKRYKKPVYITENGVADMKDNFRGWYIENVLRNVHRAIQEGVDVRGYLHWALTDNFEWDSGFWPRFGLVEIDYDTLKRTVRPSAEEYAKIIKQNGVSPPVA